MLIKYFFRKLLLSFLLLLLGLLCILGFGDILVRLAVLPSLASIPKMIGLMLPIVSVMAIPLATCLSVSFIIGKLYQDNESVMLLYMPHAYKALIKSVCIFSVLISLPYAYIVFELAPNSYFQGKQFIVTLAKDRVSELEPGIFHNLMNKGTLYFQDKAYTPSGVKYKNIMLTYKSRKNGEKYVVTAREGLFQNETFYLKDGTLASAQKGKDYVAGFSTTELSMDKVFNNTRNDNLLDKEVRFLTLGELNSIKNTSPRANMEFHTRVSQVLWQLLLPMIALILMLTFSQSEGSNLLLGVACSTVSFLLSYVGIGIAKSLNAHLALMLFIFYGIPLIVLFLLPKRRAL